MKNTLLLAAALLSFAACKKTDDSNSTPTTNFWKLKDITYTASSVNRVPDAGRIALDVQGKGSAGADRIYMKFGMMPDTTSSIPITNAYTTSALSGNVASIFVAVAAGDKSYYSKANGQNVSITVTNGKLAVSVPETWLYQYKYDTATRISTVLDSARFSCNFQEK